jgi:hypothetical protein
MSQWSKGCRQCRLHKGKPRTTPARHGTSRMHDPASTLDGLPALCIPLVQYGESSRPLRFGQNSKETRKGAEWRAGMYFDVARMKERRKFEGRRRECKGGSEGVILCLQGYAASIADRVCLASTVFFFF